MARILVTGGSGFVGAGVVAALAARGDDVTVFDIARSRLIEGLLARHKNIAFVGGEMTEWPQVAETVKSCRPDAVVHCAALVSVTSSLATPIATFRVNVEGSLNLLESMRLFGVRRMVNLSSEETYGAFDAPLIDETHPNRPRAPYGISKFAVERLALDYVDRHGMECINVRTCWVYGPGFPRPRIPKILTDAAAAGTRLHLPGGGDFAVDHTYIDDCVDGVLRCLDKFEHAFDVYHVASGEAHSIGAIVGMIKELVPAADIAVGSGPYRFVDGTEPVRKGALDIARARRELGYEPKFPMKLGLAACIEAARAGRG